MAPSTRPAGALPLALSLGLSLSCMLGSRPLGAQVDPDHRLTDVQAYLLPLEREIALARSAAPPEVGAGATVQVLTDDGYRVVVEGENGFTCIVQRSWSSPFTAPDFWTVRLIAPICYNEEAARTALAEYLRRTELVLEGHSHDEIRDVVLREVGSGALPAPRRFAMSYMLSAHQWIGSSVGRWKPHVMFYAPYLDREDLGGSHDIDSGFPLIFEYEGGPLATIVVPVPNFVETALPPGR